MELGEVLVASGRADEGLAHMQDALGRQRRIFEDDNPAIATTLNTIGFAYTSVGRFASADSTLNESLRILQLHFEDDHPAIRAVRSNLARLDVAQRRKIGSRR